MNKYILKAASALLLMGSMLTMNSCSDFLSQEPQTALSTEQVFADLDNVQPFLNGVYYAFRRTRYERTGLYCFLGLDETRQGDYQVWTEAPQASLDYYNGLFNRENVCVAAFWNVRWPVIIRASQAIDALERMEVDSADVDRVSNYIGQAKFYRGAMLFEMTQYWGALPIPSVKNGAIELAGRKTLTETYDYVISDLEDAMDRLPEEKQEDLRIPTKWAAQAVLGRLYMSAWEDASLAGVSGKRDYKKAHELLSDIIDNGPFRLMPDYADLWNPEKSCEQEAIYSLYWGTISMDCSGLQWHIGSRAATSPSTCYFGGYDLVLTSAWSYSKASETIDGGQGLWENGDLRFEESIRTNYVYNGVKCTEVTGFGDDQLGPHYKKYEDIRTDGVESFWNASKTTYYLRLADVMLLDAECLAMLGDQGAACNLINQVRDRGFGGAQPAELRWSAGASQEEFIDKLFDERTRELSCEGWRRIDLIRAGLYQKRVMRHNKWAKETGYLENDNHFLLYPIPDTEIKTNPNLTEADQNPGY